MGGPSAPFRPLTKVSCEPSVGMTDSELLSLHRAGQRIKPRYSMHDAEKDIGPHAHHWRVIVCDGGESDVCECSKCGKQSEFACDFDDEYS